MSCKCININKQELGYRTEPLTYNERKQYIDEIEKLSNTTFHNLDKLDDTELMSLYMIMSTKTNYAGSHNIELLGEDKEIHRITKNMEDQILKDEYSVSNEINIGSYVKYSKNWLKSTGNYTGNLPRGIGRVINIEKLGKDLQLAIIQWNYKDIPDKVNVKNLILADKIENV